MDAVFFDLDGTLLHYTRDYGDVLADAIRSVEGRVDDGAVEAYNDAFFEAFGARAPDPFRRAFAEVGDDPDALVESLREREVAACRPPDHARADLARLADEFGLGVLTNGLPEWQRHKLRAHDLEPFFDAVVTSYEAGAHKPDPAPYRLAEARLPADRYAMVGDAEDDVDGARAVGWETYEYHGQGFGDLPGGLTWE